MKLIAFWDVCAAVVCGTLIFDIIYATRLEVIKYLMIDVSKVVKEATFYAPNNCDCRKYCLMTDNCTAISATRMGKNRVMCLPTKVGRPYKYLVWPQQNGAASVTRTYMKTDLVQWFWSIKKVTDIRNSSVVNVCRAEGGLPVALVTNDDYDHLYYIFRMGVSQNGSAIALYGSVNPTWYVGVPLLAEVKSASIIGDPGLGECFLYNINSTYEHASCDQQELKQSLCRFEKNLWLSAVGALL